MIDNLFFNEQKEQSLIKSMIVAKYFAVWSKVIISTLKKTALNQQKIAYIDLFAGPGRYCDGAKSTPVKILEQAINDNDLKDRLITIFNDKDEDNSKSLQKTISEIDGIKKLKYIPEVHNQEVGVEIVKILENVKIVPTLFFVDPWGYKGLSLRLVNSVLKDWGCDAIFFFNYNRINMGLSNPFVVEHMEALFGEGKGEEMKNMLENKNAHQREQYIVEELCQSLKRYARRHEKRYVLPFRFKDAKGRRTSHHLVFVSKHFRGYDIMKGIMAKESTDNNQGVASFEYNPADFLSQQSLLAQLYSPLSDLKTDLIQTFRGKSLLLKEIYKLHSVDKPYILKNYQDVMKDLLKEGLIEAVTEKGTPPRIGTFSEKNKVTFL